jgi:hypothetical protein
MLAKTGVIYVLNYNCSQDNTRELKARNMKWPGHERIPRVVTMNK